MIEVNYIIVGQGLAGSTLARELLQRGKKVMVVDRGDVGSSSRVAAGLITPVTGKGMNPGWRQAEYLEYAVAYYQKLERETGEQFYFSQPVLRMFSSEKESKKWSDKKGENNQWAEVTKEVPAGIVANHGCLLMPEAAWVDTRTYLDVIRELLIKSDAFYEDDFLESDVVFKNDRVYWRDFSACKIILCQGAYGLGKTSDNSWFSHVPHRSAKGEILTLNIDRLDPSFRYHTNGWLAPRADGMWKAGASYDWVNLNSEPTDEGREEVLSKTKSWVSSDLKIDVVDHAAGVRPIIRNSRPVVGFHHEMSNVGFFNGLGSKGTMMAPAVAKHFAKHLCGECELDQELALNFQKDKGMKHETITGSLLYKAHQLIHHEIKQGETVVDATVGNGHDTLFLANCVGVDGKVIGFDIQKAAIDATQARLFEAGIDDARFELHQCSHDQLESFFSDEVAVIMFNLGYLPSGDKAIITKLESTMIALKSALMKLRKNGILSVMCYPGHSGGDAEAAAVKQWFTETDGGNYEVIIYQREGAKDTTPFLMTTQKKT